MKASTKIVLSTIGLGLLASATTLLVQPPASWTETVFAFHFALSANTLTFVLHIGAAWLFLLSLHVYKEKLQRAFFRIVAGIVLIAAGMLQLPILDALDKWDSMYVNNGFIGLPYLFGGLLVYLGVARFGSLVNARSWFKRKMVVLPATVLLVALTSLLPHVQQPNVDELATDALVGILAWTMFLLLAASILFFTIRKSIGQHYKTAMLWSGIGALFYVLSLLVAIADTLVSPTSQSLLSQLLNVLTIIAGLAWLRAGYAFRKTKDY